MSADKFDPNRKYISVLRFEQFLHDELGYEAGTRHRESDSTHYKRTDKTPAHMPESLTMSYPKTGIDGHPWFDREVIFSLLDRISDDADDGLIYRAIRKLDS